jgi:hypothetical protein
MYNKSTNKDPAVVPARPQRCWGCCCGRRGRDGGAVTAGIVLGDGDGDGGTAAVAARALARLWVR